MKNCCNTPKRFLRKRTRGEQRHARLYLLRLSYYRSKQGRSGEKHSPCRPCFLHLIRRLCPGRLSVQSGARVRQLLIIPAGSPSSQFYNEVHGTLWEPKADIKDYTRSPADLQRLLLILDSFYKTNLAAM